MLFDTIGTGELLVAVMLVLLLFGPGKTAEIARGLGKGFRSIMGQVRGIRREIDDATRLP